MDSFHKLTKEIDALTYNARSVLNALNRTVISASSTNGFTIKRSGQELVLTRPLIYRLFRFYEEWSNNQFSIVTNTVNRSFDDILAAQDLVPVTDDVNPPTALITSPASKAVVIHSKILYMNDGNVANNADTPENNQFWLDMVKNANNPKLITNSAPIPLNIRTPIFDENLSTTRFLTHESYLFPYAYFALDQLGYIGDGIRHQLSGLSWDINAEEYVRLSAPKISVGRIDLSAPLKTLDRREGEDSFAWGTNTHARGRASTAGGDTTMAVADASIALGQYSLATDFSSIVLGYFNGAYGDYSIAAAGSGNISVASFSAVLGGSGNVAGEEPTFFQFKSTVVSTADNCVVDFLNCTAQFTEGGSSVIFNKNIITIDGFIFDRFFVGDFVKLFNFTTNVNGSPLNSFYSVNGDAFPSFGAIISGVSFEGPTEENPTATERTVITLDRVVDYPNIDGGYLSVIFRSNATTESSTSPGYGCFVTGIGNIATGTYQTVVGQFNKRLATALFVVGTGDGPSNRINALVVNPSEVIAYGTESLSGPLADDSFLITVNPSQALLKGGLGYVKADNTSTYMKNGIFGSGDFGVSEFEMIGGATRLFAGSFLEATVQSFASVNVTGGPFYLSASGINLTAIDTSSISMSATDTFSYINHAIYLYWPSTREEVGFGGLVGGLRLSGQTYGALPTNDNQYSHVCGDGTTYPQAALNTTVSNVSRSGFFQFYDNTGDPTDGSFFPTMSLIGGNSNRAWLLNVSGKDLSINDDEVYDAWQMAFGMQVGVNIDGQDTLGNIAVRRVRNSFGSTVIEPNGQRSDWRYVAWKDEVDAVAANLAAQGQWTVFPTVLGFDSGTAIFNSVYMVYTVIGKTLIVKIQVDWTAAVAFNGITFTLPFNVHPLHNSNRQPAHISKSTTDGSGSVFYAGLNSAYVRPDDTGALNPTGTFGANLIYELP